MLRCNRCGRRLKNVSPNGMGPVCAAALLGAKPKRKRAQRPADAAQVDLFAEVAP